MVLSLIALLPVACSNGADDNIEHIVFPVAGTAVAAQAGDSVLVHYRGTLDDGTEFDSSMGREPLGFVIDSGMMIPGFNDAVRGMELGETITIRLEPGEAYGEKNKNRIFTVPKKNVPEGTSVNQQLVSADGRSVIVVKIEGETVTLDANHKLAGESLTFEIELVEIQ